MEVILSAREMRRCDEYAIRTLRIPAAILMENAGRSVCDAIIRHLGDVAGLRILVCCGKGNNGGDGLVIARHLLNRHATVDICLTSTRSNLSRDAREMLRPIEARIRRFGRLANVTLTESCGGTKLNRMPVPDAIVDAIFGTGFTGAPGAQHLGLIRAINSKRCPVFSVDIPSGVDADTGDVAVQAVRATVTIALGAWKPGLLMGAGREHAGQVEIGDISLPSEAVPLATSPRTYIVGSADVASVLPRRPLNAHKHTVGKVFVLAGSPGLTGAAYLCAQSALTTGAGAVVLGVPKSVYTILAKKLTEVMVVPLAETRQGSISSEAWPEIQKYLTWADVVAAGPGLGRETDVELVVKKILKHSVKPVVLDADALNALGQHSGTFARRNPGGRIFTPHVGEFSRLTGWTGREIEADRIEKARMYAVQHGVTLVLKGSPTVTATPAGTVCVNSTGNPGMATAGAGDVLTGCIAGLLGQGMSTTMAGYGGALLHGLAGDIACEKRGERSLLAGDILRFLPMAFRTLDRTVLD